MSKTEDFFDRLFDSIMQRVEGRIYDAAESVLDFVESEVDNAITKSQREAVFQQQRQMQQQQQGQQPPQSTHRKRKRRPAKPQHAIQNFYEVLEVSPFASRETIESAYRSLAKRFHPDVNKSKEAQERIRQVTVAWGVLGDVKKRAEYDKRIGV